MAEAPDDRRTRDGTRADAKINVSKTASVTVGAATLASSILYVVGCLKGHQFYVPDDALLLNWCAWLLPGVLWCREVAEIVGDIIINRLKKAET